MSGEKNVKVYMVGPSFRTQGGISSVLNIYRSHYKGRLNLEFIPTYSGKGRLKDLFYFAQSVVTVFFLCMRKKEIIFHIHMASFGSYLRKSILARIGLAFHKKVVLHIHGAMFDHFIENAGARRKAKILGLLNRVHKVVVLSRSWQKYFSLSVPLEKIMVIYNPSSTFHGIYAPRNNVKPIVLFMGRLGKRKGTYDLIEAVKRIRSCSFTLTLYGDGEVSEIQRIIDEEGLNDVVSVNDWVPHSEVEKLYDRADILVLPSYAEGLPMSVLEAIGKGLPVIATRVGGIPEAVIDGENGFLIDPGDIEALAQKLELLVRDPGIRERMGRKSLQITQEHFSIESVEKSLEELYRELSGESSPVAAW